MRRAHRIDANQRDIIEILEQIGATVQSLAALGQGCPDLLVGFRGLNYCLEVKDGAKSPSERKLTQDEACWHARWRGQVMTVCSVDEALAAINAIEHQLQEE